MAGSASSDELRELAQLLDLYPDFKQLDDVLYQFPNIDESVTRDITDQAFATQYVKMLYADKDGQAPAFPAEERSPGLQNRKSLVLKIIVVAASLLLLVIVVTTSRLGGKTSVTPSGVAVHKEATTKNGKSKLTLPDGTIVYLNANSYLEYGDNFNTINRDVALTGEAYFDVAHNADKPFIVHTSKATIRVLGTQFNVKNYSGEVWEATLLNGRIEMYLNNKPKNKLTLEPSQKVSVSALDKKHSVEESGDFRISVTKIKPLENDIAETAWVEDKLIFVDQSLEEIAKNLERTFSISVQFRSNRAKAYKYTGAFKNDDLQQILQILDLSNPIEYELKDNRLIIQ